MIMQELENAVGIDPRALITFRPGMTDAREKLQWLSMRVTTLQEDIAYSLFSVFGVHIPVNYGKMLSGGSCRRLWPAQATSLPWIGLDWNAILSSSRYHFL